MLKRIGIYLREMFPLPTIIGSMMTAVAVQLIYLRLYNVEPYSIIPTIIPAFVLTCASLLIRIMDEFKDYQDDLTNFPHRPLPSGRVTKKDLFALGMFCVFIIFFLSLSSMKLLVWALAILVYSFLMLKWFFIEKTMRGNLPLAFLSHHPIVLFHFVYLVISCKQFDSRIGFENVWYVLPLCFMFTNWEVVRKIRAPEQETSYITYSKIFGPRPAITIALFLQMAFIITVQSIFQALGTTYLIQVFFVILQLGLLLPSLKFLFSLKLEKPLKPVAEKQIFVVVLTLLVTAFA